MARFGSLFVLPVVRLDLARSRARVSREISHSLHNLLATLGGRQMGTLLPLICLFGVSAFGQNDGIPTFSTIEDHGVDAINLQNLDVLINPTVRDKGGAIPFHFGLVGNSNCDLITWNDVGGNTHTGIFCGISSAKGHGLNNDYLSKKRTHYSLHTRDQLSVPPLTVQMGPRRQRIQVGLFTKMAGTTLTLSR